MSQQEMHFEEIHRDGPEAAAEGYARGLPYTHEMPNVAGQKLLVGTGPSWNQRLILAVVSLLLWVVLFWLVTTMFMAGDPRFLLMPALGPVLLIGLLLFTAMIIIINVLFNRKLPAA